MDSPPPDDGVCEECNQPLEADYDERIVAVANGYIVTELICGACKWKESTE
jgi:hypothetical protein